MVESIRWILQESNGAQGGEYYHLDTGDEWIPVKKEAIDSRSLSRNETVYAVEAPDSVDWYSADYSSNQNNRNYWIRRYRHGDFPAREPESWTDYQKPDCRERQVEQRLGYEEILKKARRTQTFRERQQVLEELHPEIRRLADACNPDYTKASPAVAQALDNLEKFLVSAAMLGRGGTRSVGNVKKYFQQAYEVEALRKGTSATVLEGDLSRRWSTSHAPPGDEELAVSRQALKQLGIGFGSPNFVLEGSVTYSVWLEFPFTKYARPDLFILRGQHSSAFDSGVRSFLNNYSPEFFETVVDEWKRGFASMLDEAIEAETSGPSSKEIRSFTENLATHLKPGLVIESKEELGSTEDVVQQLEVYDAIFQEQQNALLAWFEWSDRVPDGVEVIDEFDTSERSARNLASFVRQNT